MHGNVQRIGPARGWDGDLSYHQDLIFNIFASPSFPTPVLEEPLTAQAAKRLIREILKNETNVMSGHALDEMEKDNLIVGDIINVLRGGVVDAPEFENGSWRYHVRTQRIEVVVCFRSETEIRVVTCWRMKR
jgi:hypothetical protein